MSSSSLIALSFSIVPMDFIRKGDDGEVAHELEIHHQDQRPPPVELIDEEKEERASERIVPA